MSTVQIAERRDFRPSPPAGGEVTCVRVAPDGHGMAFAVVGGEKPGIHAVDPQGKTRYLVRTDREAARDLQWSPDGTMVAYLLSPDGAAPGDSAVGWARAVGLDGAASGPKPRRAGRASGPEAEEGEGACEIDQMGGTAFAWSLDSDAVFVYAPQPGGLWRHAVTERVATPVGAARDDGNPAAPARLALSPDRQRIALATRRMFDDRATVTIFTRKATTAKDGSPEWESAVLTDVPGASTEVLPFWSPKGVTVMLHIVFPERGTSGMVAFRGADDDGEIVYESPLPDALETPAWARSGKHILFFRAVNEEPIRPEIGSYRLSAFDVEARRVLDVGEPGEMEGTPRFLDPRTLAVDGGEVGHVLTLRSRRDEG
jgi:dipeptidyl aminopeptidase/acylaminoacyl peptidase